MNPIERKLVLVIGNEAVDTHPFAERKLTTQVTKPEDAASLFSVARAIVISEQKGDLAKVKEHFRSILPQAECHGLILVVLVHSEEELNLVQLIKSETQTESGCCSTVEIYLRQRAVENPILGGKKTERFEFKEGVAAAEFIRREYSGPLQQNWPELKPNDDGIGDEQKILLSRAFWDCTRIHLESLSGGKASQDVYRVHAWCQVDDVGPKLLPFFVKIGEPSAIERERQIYGSHAGPYIPFNLRPNLDRRRCVHGSKLSALVGNFVEDAVPLRQALRQSSGAGVIFALFETSLKGFRVQPFTSTTSKRKKGLDAFVRDRSRCNELKPEIIAEAKRLGLKVEPKELEKCLGECASNVAHWWGPIHGDLHAGNVMVRRGDAILIDLGSVANGPLTADPATLEVSLVFGTDKNEGFTFDDWKLFVDDVYSGIPDIRPLSPEMHPTQFTWLRHALRELRHILFGCDCHNNEAALVLASYLLRFGRLDLEELSDPKLSKKSVRELRDLATSRHAYALVIAERIVDSVVMRPNDD
jgi:hypothetical protein